MVKIIIFVILFLLVLIGNVFIINISIQRKEYIAGALISLPLVVSLIGILSFLSEQDFGIEEMVYLFSLSVTVLLGAYAWFEIREFIKRIK